MKKLLVLAMMVTMVMGFSFTVMADGHELFGPFITCDEDIPLHVYPEGGLDLNARANIAGRALIEVTEGGNDVSYFIAAGQNTDLAEVWLSGMPGIYGNDGSRLTGILQSAWPNTPSVHEGTSGGDNENVAKFTVTTNTPIDVVLEMTDTSNWFDYETIFAVYERARDLDNGQNTKSLADFQANLAGLVAMTGMDADDLAGAPVGGYIAAFGTANPENWVGFGETARIRQDFVKCTPRDYELYIGFVIDEICQNEAGKFDSVINVTVEEPPVA